jgi:hypothetical protein
VCDVIVMSLFRSAGIGRTGAFCSLSTAIERVKSEGVVDVFHTVKHLRTQRPHMVQSAVSGCTCHGCRWVQSEWMWLSTIEETIKQQYKVWKPASLCTLWHTGEILLNTVW